MTRREFEIDVTGFNQGVIPRTSLSESDWMRLQELRASCVICPWNIRGFGVFNGLPETTFEEIIDLTNLLVNVPKPVLFMGAVTNATVEQKQEALSIILQKIADGTLSASSLTSGTPEFFQNKIDEITQEIIELKAAVTFECVVNPSRHCGLFRTRLKDAQESLIELTNLLNASITRSLEPPITEQPPIIEIDPIVEGEPVTEPIIEVEPIVIDEPDIIILEEKPAISLKQIAVIGGIALLLL